MSGKPTTVKLSGVLEAMGMALPRAAEPQRPAGPSITDTRLPVGFDDDEITEYEERYGPDRPVPPSVAVIEQRQPPAEEPVEEPVEVPITRNRGAWARAHTEPHPLYRHSRRSNARVRTYSVAYYRSEHALATATAYDSWPPPVEAPRNERRVAEHFDVMGYRGRHRWFKG
jgi:hypothetical protein